MCRDPENRAHLQHYSRRQLNPSNAMLATGSCTVVHGSHALPLLAPVLAYKSVHGTCPATASTGTSLQISARHMPCCRLPGMHTLTQYTKTRTENHWSMHCSIPDSPAAGTAAPAEPHQVMVVTRGDDDPSELTAHGQSPQCVPGVHNDHV